MKRYLLSLGLILSIVCCSTKQSDNTTTQNKGEKKGREIKNQIDQENIIGPSLYTLQGIWAENEDENALFFIKEDSLYYVEHQDDAVPLKLKGDTLILMGDIPVNCKILKLTNDSLWFIYEFSDIPIKLYKRK